jgi:tetratricopeptide (TPR) repeat protein
MAKKSKKSIRDNTESITRKPEPELRKPELKLWISLGLLAVIIVVSFAVYANALGNGFVYDDDTQVLQNRWIKDIRYLPDMFSKNVWGFDPEHDVTNYYRPLMHIIYMIEYHVFGLSPWGFHLVNILFHIAVSIMVFIIARRLLGKYQSPAADAPMLAPLVAALLFATHPIHTEAVTWIAGVPDVSFAFFYLLSFYFYTRTEEGFKSGYLLSIVSFSIAAFSKEPALTLPLILFAYDYSFRKPEPVFNYLRRYSPYFGISGVYLVLRSHALGGFAPATVSIELSTYQYIINVFQLLRQYIEKLFFPVNLNAYHVFHPITSIFEPNGFISLIVTLAFIGCLIVAQKKNKVAFLGLSFFLIPLLPVFYISKLGLNTLAERYLYLPSVGYAILFAVLLQWARRKSPGLANGLTVCCVVVIGLYSAGTINRNQVWKDDFSLYSDRVKKSPEVAFQHYNLGVEYMNRKQYDEASAEFQTALALKPGNVLALDNLGTIYLRRGELDKAIAEFQEALRYSIGTKGAKTLVNLGVAYRNQHRLEEAAKEFEAALRLKPDLLEARSNLGAIYLIQNRLEDAAREFQTVIKLKPDHEMAHLNLGVVYRKENKFQEAVNEFRTTLQLSPNFAEAHYELGVVYGKQQRFGEAINEFRATLQMKPDFAPARTQLALIINSAQGKQKR